MQMPPTPPGGFADQFRSQMGPPPGGPPMAPPGIGTDPMMGGQDPDAEIKMLVVKLLQLIAENQHNGGPPPGAPGVPGQSPGMPM